MNSRHVCRLLSLALLIVPVGPPALAGTDGADAIHLELSPRVCTLATADRECALKVTARWNASREESLCLLILERPDIKQCWEHFAKGIYTVDLQFAEDLTVQLRDLQLQQVLATRALRVIREVLQFRRLRREPWNVLF